MRILKKTNILFICLILITLTASLNVKADAGEERTVYLSATEYDYPPFSVTDNGEADGFSVELLKEVAQEMGIVVTFKVDQWSVLKEELKNGELDILPLVGYTEERDEIYDFTVPYIVMRGNIFVRKGDDNIHSQEDLFGKEILVLEGDNSQEWALSIGLDTELTATATYLEAFQLLSSGQYDAVLAQGLVGEKLISDHGLDNIAPVYIYDDGGVTRQKLNLEGYEQKFCFAVVEGDTELLSILNEGLSIISVNGTYDELYQKWFPFLLEDQSMSAEEITRYVIYIVTPILALLVIAYFITTRRTIRIKTNIISEEKERSEKYFHDLVLSGKIFETSIENAPIPIMIHAEDGTVINISETWTKLTGYQKDDIPTIYDWTEKAYGLKKEEVREFITKLYTLTSTQHDGEYEVDTKDGRKIIWDFYSTHIGNLPDGRAVAMSIATDITEFKKQEAEKQQTEEKYRLLFETMSQGVVYQDGDGYITECNHRAEEILGLSLDQMQGKTSIDPRWKMIDEEGHFIPGEDHPAMVALRTKEVVGPIIRGVYVPENDNYRWLLITATPIILKKNEDPHQVYATFEDITEQKKADLEVVYRKELLQYIISRSNQGIAVHDRNLNYVYVSDRYCEMYNVSKDILGKHHYEVFPDLPQKWRDVHQKSLKGETVSGDRDPITRSDGSIQFTRWLSQPWYDIKGEIAGIIIYTEVINDLVDTEFKLHDTLDRLQLVMDNLTIGIAVNSVDPTVEFEYMNENFAKFYGTTKKALMKSDAFWDVVYEDEVFREEIKQKVLKGLASNDPKLKRWEYVPITKNGKVVRYITAQGVNVPNFPLVISMVMDVTDQKHKEDEIIYNSNHDLLTGLPNRRYFEEKLKEFNQDKYFPLVVAMFDFDGLKLINDAYGHDIGDEALIKISNVLKESLNENDFVARVGGDEFVMLCPHTTKNEFDRKQSHITNNVRSIKHLDMSYSLSSGYDIKTDSSIKITDILKNAENSMFANKTLHGQSSRSETIITLFETLKDKYDTEKLHSDRVSHYCKLMGEKLNLNQNQIKELEFAGLMHDIGKITIPDSILDKPGKLTDDEWVIMKKHTINGYQILKSADKYSRLAEYALTHHERWDGKGYPNGLSGEDIPLFSRIISIADAYEAMTADRPYRKALTKEIAIDELNRCVGSQFDAKLVDVFINEVLLVE